MKVNAFQNGNVSILSYNAQRNVFSVQYKEKYYESTTHFKLEKALCIGHIKILLTKALDIEHIGYIQICKYAENENYDRNYLKNDFPLREDLRFIHINICDEVIDSEFMKKVNFYHLKYGIPIA